MDLVEVEKIVDSEPRNTNHSTAVYAPVLTDEKLAQYETLIKACPNPLVKEAGLKLLNCVKVWWELPVSTEKSIPSGFRDAKVTPLSRDLRIQLWECIPWKHELDAMTFADTKTGREGGIFTLIPKNEETKGLLTALYHLHWFACELFGDREPLTQDMLGK